MEREFTEFSEFKESDKSLKPELGQAERPSLLPGSGLYCGSILVSNTRGGWIAGSSPFTVMTSIFSLNSVKHYSTEEMFGWKPFD